MKKQISKLLIFMIMVQATASMFFSQSYAADKKNDDDKCDGTPEVCTATSPHMTTYLEFQKEAATILSTNRFKTVQRQVSE
jgi:hypothetical protein